MNKLSKLIKREGYQQIGNGMMMSFCRNYYVFLGILICIFRSGCGYEFLNGNLCTSTQIVSGFREDEVVSLVAAYIPPFVTPNPPILIFTDHLKGKDVRIYEIGIKQRITFCNEWFARGYATSGTVKDGEYVERIHISNTARNSDTVTRACIRQGNVRDASAGIGYLFPIWKYFECDEDLYLGFGPVFGWAWHYQRIKMQHAKTRKGLNASTRNTNLDGLVYKNRWEGPWIGLESIFSNEWFELNVGYEYHWPNWKAEWLLAIPDIKGVVFSDIRTGDVYFGSEAFANARYFLFDCCYFEAGLKFQYWRGKRGKEVPRACSLTAVGVSPTQKDKVPKTSWRAFSVDICIGYVF